MIRLREAHLARFFPERDIKPLNCTKDPLILCCHLPIGGKLRNSSRHLRTVHRSLYLGEAHATHAVSAIKDWQSLTHFVLKTSEPLAPLYVQTTEPSALL